ncbi:MAG: hypothetical protein GY768_26080 [Planctomycetaceae bacterium]|nr:hypothetical protein [Planctomycetaceae bacterium]
MRTEPGRNHFRGRSRKITSELLESRQMLAVVISEFMAENEATWVDQDGDYSDWVEVRNTGDSSIDLQGWYLTDAADNPTKWQFPKQRLDSGEQLVVFASGKDRRGVGQELHTNFKLSSNGEYLGLMRPGGVALEFEYSPNYPAQSSDVSYGVSFDGNQQGYFLTPTPGELNIDTPIADLSHAVVISEMMYSLPRDGILDAERVDQEFIELHNLGSSDISLAGWRLTRGVNFEFPAVTLPAQGYLVVAADTDAFTQKYENVTNWVGGWEGKLSNSGETIELVDGLGNVIDQLRYASEGDWAIRTVGPDDRGSTGWIWTAGHDGGNKSLELVNRFVSNDFGQNWTSSLVDGGTPGASNSTAEANSAPFISDVLHQPAIPKTNESVTVSAVIKDETIGANARLHWKIDTEVEFNTVAMLDDGQGSDGLAGDSIFSATIPPQADRTVIEFFVEAVDVASNQRTWPAATSNQLQEANALYQVLDDFDQDQRWNPENPPVYFQIMTNAERQAFTDVNRQSDAQFNATFISVDGSGVDVHYNTGIRLRGSASRNNAVPSNRINFPNDRDFQGFRRINLNAASAVNNIAGAALFRLAGVEMADARGVRMYSNGVDLRNGFYAHVEQMDSDFVDLHYPEDRAGNLYRGRRPDESPPGGEGAGLAYLGTESAPYVSYGKNTNASEADWSDVIQLTDLLNNSPAETYVQDVQQVANVQQWFRTFAMNSLIGNTEAGLFTGDDLGDDYAMYRGEIDTRFTMIPYDLDSVFANAGRDLDEPRGVPALDRLMTHPEFRYQLYREYEDLIQNVIRTDQTEETIRQVLRGVATESRIEEILGFLEQRAQNVTDDINQMISIGTNTDVVSDLPRTTAPELTLSGRAPESSTLSMTVNGQEVTGISANRSWEFNIAGNQIVESQVLIDAGSDWNYLDDGSDQGTAWRQAGFDDQGWAVGPAQLGYGDDDERTVISNGGGQDNAPTTYFRRTFSVDDLEKVDLLSARLLYDDAAAVYLNGTEVIRTDNLGLQADFDDYASATRPNQQENDFVPFELSADLLLLGENLIAVEVHQAGPDSSDLSFDLELTARDVEIIDVDAVPELELFPGLNRYTVAAFDQLSAAGNKVDEQIIDVWYDDGSSLLVSADIGSDTTWSAADGPFLVQSDITIAAGATLTIEPGTTVFFGNNGRLTVRGTIHAVGKPFQEIRFTREPGEDEWNGIQFRDAMSDNRIEHAIVQYGITGDGMLGLENSSLVLDHVTLDNTDRRRVRSIDSSLVIRNSIFTNIFDPDEAPTTDNQSEHIWGRGVPENGQWIIEDNVFGHITGHNDHIDFDASRLPNPISVIRNNLFVGGGDDALDMTGDVWIEGNRFHNFIKDEFNTDPGESNTISSSAGTFWTIGNLFSNVQHASLVKEDAFMHFINNTVVNAEFAPLYFDLPGQTDGPGRGAYVENSVFPPTPTSFEQIQPDTDLTVSHSFLSDDLMSFEGNGNLFGNANMRTDGTLAAGSFALGAGSDGQDMGAEVTLGASLRGVPLATTAKRDAMISVGGPTITHFRYRIDEGELSSELPVGQTIQLNDLTEGLHTLVVVGKNQLGNWQSAEQATTATWNVDSEYRPAVVISELLATDKSDRLGGNSAGWIELFNPSSTPIDLSNYSITDDRERPTRFVFPADTVLAAGDHLTLSTEQPGDGAGEWDLGFALNDDGEAVYLFDDGATKNLVDSVEFGLQLPGLSISRLGDNGEWGLSLPTPGLPNQAHPVAEATGILINEWLASGEVRVETDFVELYNSAEFPVDLGGHYLSDDPFAIPEMSEFRPLSFIAAKGFRTLIADGDIDRGADHLDFRISPDLEQIGFFAPDLTRIDLVFSPPQTSDVSMGRVPDGDKRFGFRNVPTPGASNGTENTVNFGFGLNSEWKYDASGSNLETAWREPEYDDSDWSSGQALIGVRNRLFGLSLQTEIDFDATTLYLRKAFTLEGEIDLSQVVASIRAQVDDGFIVYLNGQEVVRQRLPDSDVRFNTSASESIFNAPVDGPYQIPAGLLQAGENVFAVEVHQGRAVFFDRDLTFGLSLEGTGKIKQEDPFEDLDQGARITELMYNPESDGSIEFVEITNVLDQPLDLTGVRLSTAIEFVFPDSVLQPHESVVVAEDVAAFRDHYGAHPRVIGEYEGKLANGGESISLIFPEPFDSAILRFDFSDRWFPQTDGEGYSLEVVDPQLRIDRWSELDAWQASSWVGGSPGFLGTDRPGDFNSDGKLDVQDIDLMSDAVRAGAGDFDLDHNGTVDLADLENLVETIFNTSIGDANLDGLFNSGDLVTVFQAGQYEDDIVGNSTWSSGDWNCDAEFSTSDLVYAFQQGQYSAASMAVQNRRPASHAAVSHLFDSTAAELTKMEAEQSPATTRVARRSLQLPELDQVAADSLFSEVHPSRRFANDVNWLDDKADSSFFESDQANWRF